MTEVTFQQAAPILCVRDLDVALDFYGRLGFSLSVRYDGYALLACECVQLHLRVDRALRPEENPCGAYFYLEGVDGFAEAVEAEDVQLLEPPSDRSWCMRECSISDPDGNLLRFGEYLLPDDHRRPDLEL
jgi:catechol 2,3-dioxygenase-like lactoylglutathione lyase family enzyme